MKIYSPEVFNKIPAVSVPYMFKYGGYSCVVFELNGSWYLPKNSIIREYNGNDFIKKSTWFMSVREKFTEYDWSGRVVTMETLRFDTKNRLATFIYANSVQVTVAFEELPKTVVIPCEGDGSYITAITIKALENDIDGVAEDVVAMDVDKAIEALKTLPPKDRMIKLAGLYAEAQAEYMVSLVDKE